MAKRQILLVENDKAFAQSTAVFLESHQYGVDIAYHGADAMQRVHSAPDVVLVEYALPDVKGTEICQKIEDDPRLSHIPVIVLFDHTLSDEERESLYIYGDDHITRPFDNNELLARIEVVCRRIRVSQQAREERDVVTTELKKIVDNGLIIPVFQPIYSMRTLMPLGVEALSRPSTDSFLSNPELFFKAAMTFGMYSRVEKLAWRKAFADWKEHIGEGKLFLNCTPYFIDNNPLDEAFFAGLGIDPSSVVVELTERTAIRNHALFTDRMNGIRRLGGQIAVDDVGSGFASLDTVAEVRPDYVKIDLSLICDIHLDSLKKNIVCSIVEFCHKSDILTVAEGIEKTEELGIVKELGIDAIQGYLLARPSREISRETFLKKWDAGSC